MRWYMSGQYLDDEIGRFIMHSVVIEPPSCYRCFSCGLCGDFKREMNGDVDGVNALETCHGGEVEFEAGWTADNAFAYDEHGNSWEQRYRDEYCPPLRGQFDTSTIDEPVEYIPAIPTDLQMDDLCDPTIAGLVVIQCQRARNESAACCQSIGGDFCGTECAQYFML